jgi:hypothetical protein
VEQALVPLPAPARKEFGAEDIAQYRKVRIYENTSFPIMIPDEASLVGDDALNEGKDRFTGSDYASSKGDDAPSEEELSAGSDDASSVSDDTPSEEEELFAGLDDDMSFRSERFEWFWSCCSCGQGLYSCGGPVEDCPEFNCGHARCQMCSIEQHKVRRFM